MKKILKITLLSIVSMFSMVIVVNGDVLKKEDTVILNDDSVYASLEKNDTEVKVDFSSTDADGSISANLMCQEYNNVNPTKWNYVETYDIYPINESVSTEADYCRTSSCIYYKITGKNSMQSGAIKFEFIGE